MPLRTGTMALTYKRLPMCQKFTRCFHNTMTDSSYTDIITSCRNIVEKELKPIAAKLDKESIFPAEQIKKLGSSGLMGILVPEKYGGAGLNTVALSLVVQEISRGCAGTGTIVSIHNALFADVISSSGTSDQKERFLPTFVNGENIGSFALSEPGSGSDAASLSTTATYVDDGWILNGTKAWVTNGYEAKAVIILARMNKQSGNRGICAFIVPIPSEGLSLGKKEEKLGIRASSTCNIVLDNVKVPKENLLGTEREGFVLAMSALNCARIGIASQAIGIAQASLDCAVEYANQRMAFGKSLLKMQAVQQRIARMASQLEAAKTVVFNAAHSRDNKEPVVKKASIAKLIASEAATSISHNCIQILGGMGYISDMPAERHYRDARITEIYAGPSDIQLMIIADQVAKEYGFSTR